jgi:hypothetical protein
VQAWAGETGEATTAMSMKLDGALNANVSAPASTDKVAPVYAFARTSPEP